jgi:hypothetical protein
MNRRPTDDLRLRSRIDWALEALEDGRHTEAYDVLTDLYYELGSAATGGTA